MNELMIPPSPNWYKDTAVGCTPDGLLIYASRRDIVILKPAPLSEPNELSIIYNAHNDRVLSVNTNMVSWGQPNKQIVSVGDDKKVNLWDFETKKKTMSHSGHESDNSQIVSASFAGERIVSVTENGQIVIWRLASGSIQTITHLFDKKTKVMCMSTCPHATYLTAFGLTTGLVIVADLRRNGRVMFRMREHDHDITGLSWCPVPYNIYCTVSGIQLMNTLKKKLYRPPLKTETNKTHDEDGKYREEDCKSVGGDNISPDKESESVELVSQLEVNDNSETQNIEETTQKNEDNITIESEKEQNLFAQMCSNFQKSLNTDSATKISVNKDTQQIEEVNTPKNKKGFLLESPIRSVNFVETPEKIKEFPKRERPVVDKSNPWGNVVFNDSDEESAPEEIKIEEKKVEVSDFLKECLNLRKQIESKNDNCDSDENKENVYETPKKNVEETNQETPKGGHFIILKNDTKEFKVLEKVSSHDSENLIENMSNLKVSTVTSEDMYHDQIADDFKSQSESSLNSYSEETHSKEYDGSCRNQKLKNPPYELDLSMPDSSTAREFLLASACRAGFVNIWRAGTDGRLEIQLRKHMKTEKSYKKRDNRQNWISLCWAQPTLILSSSIWNELLAWDLMPKPIKNRYQLNSSLVHTDHKKYIFTISVPFTLYATPSDEDWRVNKDLRVWTTSLDRWLLCTNLSTKCNICCYCTSGGVVSCLAVSQLDPNRIAFAAGDGAIKVWDLSRPHLQHIIMTSFFDKVHTKASWIDWHPTKENCLAFSTCEGRIGEYDLTNRSKTAVIYSNYHRSTVYKIQWGPLPHDRNSNGLYSCSLGELVVHDPNRPNKEPHEIKIFDDENVTMFSWKSDYSILAVGSRTGSVKLITPDLEPIQTLYMQKKSVRCLEWHPLATAYDSGLSEFSNFLAVATNESNIFVYDCTQTGGNEFNRNAIVLEGHKNAVKYIAWCPHLGGRLVSSCEDGFAIVWDVKTRSILSTYLAKHDCATPVIWSPLDADLIMLGGKFLTIWRITKNPPNFTELHNIKSQKTKKKDHKSEASEDRIKTENEMKKVLFTKMTKRINNRQLAITSCKALFEKSDVKEHKKDNVQSDSDSDEQFEDAKEENDLDESLADPVKLFGNRKDALSLLNYELHNYMSINSDISVQTHLGLWKGDLAGTINYALEKKRLNPWIISLAPMVSHKLWQECCEKYADFLKEESNYLEASSYYLICHDVEEAIYTLVKGSYIKEALALARVRLPEDSPIIQHVIEQLIKKTRHDGVLEFTALCYIYLGKLNDAAEVLNKRDIPDALQLAANIAKKIDNKDLLSVIELKLNGLPNSKIEETGHINILSSRLEAILMNSQEVNMASNEDTEDNQKENVKN